MKKHIATAEQLNISAQQGDIDTVKTLIREHGVDVNAIADIKCSNGFRLYGSTALHQASQNLHFDIVKYLISEGANVNAQSRKAKYTPVHAVACNIFIWDKFDHGNLGSSSDIVTLLLKHGADPTRKIQSVKAYTALDLAENHDAKSIIPLLIDAMKTARGTKELKADGSLSLRLLNDNQKQELIEIELIIKIIKLENHNIKIETTSWKGPCDLIVQHDKSNDIICVKTPVDTAGNSSNIPDDIVSTF